MRAIAVLYNLILVPGVGQIAIGRWRRGLPWLVAAAFAPLTALIHPWAILLVFLVVKLGSPIEVGLLEARDPLRGGKLLAAYGGGLVAAMLWFSLTQTFVVEAFRIPSGAMVPTLRIGDHMFVSKLAYRFGEPARGDVAVFVNPCEPDKDFVKRVVGLPGDTIEVRCDVLYINGVAAPATALKEECSYWDRKEDGGPWVPESCTTYVEVIDGREHEIVHSPGRRERDKLRKLVAGERSYGDLMGDADFPDEARPLPACPSFGRSDPPPPLGRVADSAPDPEAGACSPRRHYVVPDGHLFFMGDNRENSSDSRRWGPVPLDHLKGKAISIWWSSRPDAQGGIAWDRIGHID